MAGGKDSTAMRLETRFILDFESWIGTKERDVECDLQVIQEKLEFEVSGLNGSFSQTTEPSTFVLKVPGVKLNSLLAFIQTLSQVDLAPANAEDLDLNPEDPPSS